MRPPIFVSYSHSDASLVRPVVALLRASEAEVFRDAENLRPGKRWREQLSTAIRDSKIVLVFWCHHAQLSEEVRKEYLAALGLDKDVLPVLIDGTPLPDELAAFQYIDFREAFAETHKDPLDSLEMPQDAIRSAAGEAAHPKSTRAWPNWLGAISTCLLIGTLAFVYWPGLREYGTVDVSPSSAASPPPARAATAPTATAPVAATPTPPPDAAVAPPPDAAVTPDPHQRERATAPPAGAASPNPLFALVLLVLAIVIANVVLRVKRKLPASPEQESLAAAISRELRQRRSAVS